MNFKPLAVWSSLILLLGFTLAGCSVFGKGSSAALPTVVLDSQSATPNPGRATTSPSNGGGVTASGVVAPAQEASLSFGMGGLVNKVTVAVGDEVQAGQPLVSLEGSEKLAAAVQAAELEQLSAQQALDALNKDLDVKQALALKAIADNEHAVRDAQTVVDNLGTQSPEVDIQAAYANMLLAKDALDRAQKNYEPYKNKAENNVIRAMLLSKLAQAQKNYNAAVSKYNNLLGTASAMDLSQAKANLAVAQANLAKSQRDYEVLKNGPDPDQVAMAQERLANAKAQLAVAKSALDDLQILAPFSGTVTKVNTHAGEWVTPGLPVVMLSDLQNARVETTDLSERDVPRITVGQPVTVFIKALNQSVTGKVKEIAPLADTLGGDVVYQTIIELDSRPEGLREGMTVEVQFGTGS
jgi:multidrug efflux pump subunit AcrA (membrane-fusion protein)